MMRNLVTSLIVHERVTTTDMKAKELRRVAERLVTKAVRVSHLSTRSSSRLSQEERAKLVHARRVASRHCRLRASDKEQQDVDVLWKLFSDIGPRFVERQGGYLRITKLPGLRKGDGAPLSIVEFVEGPSTVADEGAKGSKKAGGAKSKRGGLLGGLFGGRGAKEKSPKEPVEDEDDDDDDDQDGKK